MTMGILCRGRVHCCNMLLMQNVALYKLHFFGNKRVDVEEMYIDFIARGRIKYYSWKFLGKNYYYCCCCDE